ncbi:DNA/RNA non-specific endonuclease, partial [Thalassolituus marinus]
RIQSALFNIIAGERAEAAMHERMLSQESAVTKVAIYTGAFMTGIGSSAWGLALWAKEVSDVVNPVVRIHNNIKAIRAAWDSENFAEAYSSNILSAEKRELVEALGFDPTAINAQQIDEAIAMSDLVMSDESLREMLYRFVKDYAEAQHSIEIAEVAGSGAFEIILTIILAAVTGGAGVLAMVGSKAALIRKFSSVGDLLSEFAQASKKIALRNSKRSAKQEKASFKDLETDEKLVTKGASGPASPAADNVTELEPGQKGGWNKELNGELKPDHSYKVGDYLYETDSEGRVSRVSGKLDLNTRDRNTYQQGKSAKEAGIKDGLADDDGGHLIASIFDGSGEQINYAPMNSNLNRGAWKSMENTWAKALEEGKEVTVDIKPVYEAGSKRPTKFVARYTIDGQPYKSIFKNQSGG